MSIEIDSVIDPIAVPALAEMDADHIDLDSLRQRINVSESQTVDCAEENAVRLDWQ